MADLRGYVTAAGQQFESLAKQMGYPVIIGMIEIGDGVLPDSESPIARTRLVNPIASFPAIVEQDAKRPGEWVASIHIPPDHAINGAGYFIREIGCKLINQGAGTLYAYRRVSNDWKPIDTSGEAKSFIYKLRFIPSNGELLKPTIDPTVVLVDREELDRVMKAHKESRDHPYASSSEPGLMRFATQQQVDDAVDDGVAVAPKKLTSHYKRANILGAVSLLAGVPTGAIIESGTNANGSYMKFADGNMIVRKSITFPQLTLPSDSFKILDLNGVTSWAWPARFSEYPEVSIQFIGAQSYAFQVQAENIDQVTVGSFHLRNHWFAQMVTQPKIQIIAIGKW